MCQSIDLKLLFFKGMVVKILALIPIVLNNTIKINLGIFMKTHIPDEFSPTSWWHISYGLMAVSFFFGFIPLIAALIMAYLKRPSTIGDPVLYSHARWQIHTIWLSFLFGILSAILVGIGYATLVIMIGVPILVAGCILGFLTPIWLVYRIVRGWVGLADRKEMPVRL